MLPEETTPKPTKEFEDANRKLLDEIAELQQVERRMAENQAFIQQIVETSPYLLYIYNLVDRKIEFANQELSRMLGYSSEDLLQFGDEVIARILHPDDLPSAIEHHLKLRGVSTDASLDLTFRARHRNGSWLWLRSRDVPFSRSDDGKVIKILSVVEDVSDKVHREKARELRANQLKQAQRMEAISSLAGGIAHDFNNILAAILGYAELSLLELPDGHPVRSHTDEIVKAGNRAKELVKQIQAFTRQECMDKIPVKFDTVLEEAIKLIRSNLPRGVEIHIDLGRGSGRILADPPQIYQALLNLCINAVQAMEGEGCLDIQLRDRVFCKEDPVLPTGRKPGDYLQLTIRDNGHGIAKKHLDCIFDPYFTTRKFGKGCGMGLAIVAGIIKNHNGFIRVESSPGHGAAFHLFPLRRRTDRTFARNRRGRSADGSRTHSCRRR